MKDGWLLVLLWNRRIRCNCLSLLSSCYEINMLGFATLSMPKWSPKSSYWINTIDDITCTNQMIQCDVYQIESWWRFCQKSKSETKKLESWLWRRTGNVKTSFSWYENEWLWIITPGLWFIMKFIIMIIHLFVDLYHL